MDSKPRLRRPPAHDVAPSKDLPDEAAAKTIEGRLLTWKQLPAWAKDNEYIHNGFRPVSNSYLDCFLSWFYVHNESGNIYSHFLAAVWMIALATYYYPYAKEHYPRANVDDWSVFGLYFLGGVICYAISTTYHTVSNHSR